MKKKYRITCIISAALLVVIVISVNYYLKYSFTSDINPYVKSVSLHLADELLEMNDKNSKITYKECFERLEQDISDANKNTINIQLLNNTERYADETKAAVDYINACKNLLRCLLTESRSQLKVFNSLEYAKKTTRELAITPSYGFKFALSVTDQAISDFKRAKKEDDEATNDIFVAAKNVETTRVSAAKYFSSTVLINKDILANFIKSSNATISKIKG